MSFLYKAFDEATEEFSAAEYAEHMATARAAFEAERGRVRPDEFLWEMHSKIFLEWYLCERPLFGRSITPMADFCSRDTSNLAAIAWAGSQRILGQVLAIEFGSLSVLDLLGGAEFRITEERRLPSLEVGDVAELRVLGFSGQIRLGRTFLQHPRGVEKSIAGILKRSQGKTPSQMLSELAKTRLRCDHFAHLTPSRLYKQQLEV